MLKDCLSDFSALQNAMDARTSREIVYFRFVLMCLDGRDLRKVPLWSRRARLSELLESRRWVISRFTTRFPAVIERQGGVGIGYARARHAGIHQMVFGGLIGCHGRRAQSAQ